MKSDLHNRLWSLVKLALISLAIIAAAHVALPNAWSQQKQDAKSKQQEPKKPTAPPRRRPGRLWPWLPSPPPTSRVVLSPLRLSFQVRQRLMT